MDHTGVHGLARAGNRLEVEVLACDFDQHKRPVGVKGLVCDCRVIQIVLPQLSGSAFHEIVNPMLWMDPLVNVFVT